MFTYILFIILKILVSKKNKTPLLTSPCSKRIVIHKYIEYINGHNYVTTKLLQESKENHISTKGTRSSDTRSSTHFNGPVKLKAHTPLIHRNKKCIFQNILQMSRNVDITKIYMLFSPIYVLILKFSLCVRHSKSNNNIINEA